MSPRVGPRVCLALLYCSAAYLSTACGPPPDLPPDLPDIKAYARQVNQSAQRLGPGDLIEVKVYLEPDLSGDYRIGPKGTFAFPLIGEVEAYRFDLITLSDELRARLGREYLRDPKVTVIIKESRSKKVFVLGLVNKPGSYIYEPSMRVVQAIALAGGLKPLASRDLVLIRETAEGERKFRIPFKEISQGQAQNSLLRPGDIIYVPESWY